MNTEKYYVVEHCLEDNWEQISQSIDSYENAIKFKDSDFVKNRFPKAFIVSTVPSQLLKQNNEVTDEREVLIKAFSDVSKEFEGREWIKEGRGPYAYDDDEYRKEVTYLFEAFDKIKSEMWSNIQSKTFEYKNQIEEPLLKQRDEALELLKKTTDKIGFFSDFPEMYKEIHQYLKSNNL